VEPGRARSRAPGEEGWEGRGGGVPGGGGGGWGGCWGGGDERRRGGVRGEREERGGCEGREVAGGGEGPGPALEGSGTVGFGGTGPGGAGSVIKVVCSGRGREGVRVAWGLCWALRGGRGSKISPGCLGRGGGWLFGGGCYVCNRVLWQASGCGGAWRMRAGGGL